MEYVRQIFPEYIQWEICCQEFWDTDELCESKIHSDGNLRNSLCSPHEDERTKTPASVAQSQIASHAWNFKNPENQWLIDKEFSILDKYLDFRPIILRNYSQWDEMFEVDRKEYFLHQERNAEINKAHIRRDQWDKILWNFIDINIYAFDMFYCLY